MEAIIKFLKKNFLLIFIIIYMLSPLDFIPEAILGPLGFGDDISLLLIELIRRYFAFKKEANKV
jgi:uncharacterized membrane protein YkvA (DUF1232 family)